MPNRSNFVGFNQFYDANKEDENRDFEAAAAKVEAEQGEANEALRGARAQAGGQALSNGWDANGSAGTLSTTGSYSDYLTQKTEASKAWQALQSGGGPGRFGSLREASNMRGGTADKAKAAGEGLTAAETEADGFIKGEFADARNTKLAADKNTTAEKAGWDATDQAEREQLQADMERNGDYGDSVGVWNPKGARAARDKARQWLASYKRLAELNGETVNPFSKELKLARDRAFSGFENDAANVVTAKTTKAMGRSNLINGAVQNYADDDERAFWETPTTQPARTHQESAAEREYKQRRGLSYAGAAPAPAPSRGYAPAPAPSNKGRW